MERFGMYEEDLLEVCPQCSNEDYAEDFIDGVCESCYQENMEDDEMFEDFMECEVYD